MSSPAKKLNGRPSTAVCRHAPGCEVVARQDDLRAQIQTMSSSMGDALCRMEARLNSIGLHLYDVGERQIRADQREEEWLRVLTELSRANATGGTDA